MENEIGQRVVAGGQALWQDGGAVEKMAQILLVHVMMTRARSRWQLSL